MPATRIATLDGVRAIAVSLVLCAHAAGTGVIPATRLAHLFGDVGVRSFFVLSGFLITTLLLRERATHGRISLRAFYRRRMFRICPAFCAYLAVAVLLAAAGWIAVRGQDLIFAATYTMNFHGHRAWFVGHLWSLAVEEQFYLIWPLALVALGLRRAERLACAALVIAPLARLCAWYFWPEVRDLTDQAFPCVFDSLAIGCLLAIVRERLEASRRYNAVLHAPWFWALPLAGIASLAVTRPWFSLGIAMTAANAGIALAIHHCVSLPHGAVGRALERPAMVRLGGLSYSLYLWQQPFLDRHADSWLTTFPVNVGLAFAAAFASYYLIERPALQLGHDLESVTRSNQVAKTAYVMRI